VIYVRIGFSVTTGGAEGDSGTSCPLDAQHDASVHALGPKCIARGDRASRLWAAGGQCRKCGGLN
jgi:hypothetical protein